MNWSRVFFLKFTIQYHEEIINIAYRNDIFTHLLPEAVRWLVILRHFSTLFGYTCVHGGRFPQLEEQLLLGVNQQSSLSNFLSWDSKMNHSEDGRVISKQDAFIPRPRRPRRALIQRKNYNSLRLHSFTML